MNSQKIATFIFFIFSIHLSNAQSIENESSFNEIKQFYDALESNKSSDVILKLISNFKFHPIDQTLQTDETHFITLEGIFQNEWSMTEVSNLKFKVIKENMILATGEFSGRRLVECETITSKFDHIWCLNDLKNTQQLTTNKQ